MNRQPFGTPPRRWEDKLNRVWVRATRGFRRRQLKRLQNIVAVEPTNLAVVKRAQQAGCGILIIANHSAHYDSNSLYVAADQINSPMYFMTAWQVFQVSSRWECKAMQMMGCFSVDRDGTDRQAFKRASEILQRERFPLVIFPEGDIYHTSDRVKPFREGAAAIALSAARKNRRKTVVVPTGIRFSYIDDPTPRLHEVATKLEQRINLRPAPSQSLQSRIGRVTSTLLTMKEREYLGQEQQGEIAERIESLTERILEDLSDRYQGAIEGTIPEQVQTIRQQVTRNADRFHRQRDLEALFLVIQLYSYPADYLSDDPSLERLAETVDKLEEDVLGAEYPSIKGRRKVSIMFDEPIDVVANGNRRGDIQSLTTQMQSRVQAMVDQLARPVAECSRVREQQPCA